MKLTKVQKAGILVIVLSLVIGVLGTIWNIYVSFERLENAEGSGIGPVGDAIRNSLFFSAGVLVMILIGAVLVILGRPRK